ncbi:MAG: hypothetical protein M1814_002604 [Vezdaea aestivalis]|nr:MAG: hypothetical protein M1814_002604 [Vezdaea aestivalis]
MARLCVTPAFVTIVRLLFLVPVLVIAPQVELEEHAIEVQLNLNPGGQDLNPLNWNRHVVSPRGRAGIDRRGRIKCGDFPPIGLPRELRSVYTSVLHICAHTEYGGRPRANVGAYCGWFHRPLPQIIFDIRAASPFWHREDAAFTRRILMYCKTKCSCAVESGDPIKRPLLVNKHPIGHRIDYIGGGDIEVLVQSLAGVPNVTVLQYPLQEVSAAAVINYQAIVISGTRDTQISCPIPAAGPGANLPDPRYLPPEFRNVRYPNLHSLCAAEMHGGMPSLNAGGICAPRPWPNGSPGYEAPLEFAADLLSVNNMPYGLTIQLWCHRHCFCKLGPTRARKAEYLVRWLYNGRADFSNGGCTFEASVKVAGNSGRFVLNLIDSRDNSPELNEAGPIADADSCPSDAGSACQTTWPSGFPKPQPLRVPLPTKLVRLHNRESVIPQTTLAAEKFPTSNAEDITIKTTSSKRLHLRFMSKAMPNPEPTATWKLPWFTEGGDRVSVSRLQYLGIFQTEPALSRYMDWERDEAKVYGILVTWVKEPFESLSQVLGADESSYPGGFDETRYPDAERVAVLQAVIRLLSRHSEAYTFEEHRSVTYILKCCGWYHHLQSRHYKPYWDDEL